MLWLARRLEFFTQFVEKPFSYYFIRVAAPESHPLQIIIFSVFDEANEPLQGLIFDEADKPLQGLVHSS